MEISFCDFVRGNFDFVSANVDCDPVGKTPTCIWLRDENMDIGGGKIRYSDIDRLKKFPGAEVVRISGLRQDTFEYFIRTYGHRLKAIDFFKNKLVEDWSLLGTLPGLEYVHFFANQRIESLWDMSNNLSLRGLSINDFSRLHSIEKIGTAPALKYFDIGNAIWDKATVESFLPLAGTGIEELSFTGKRIDDNDLSFLSSMNHLKRFDFSTNMFSTEQVAWIAANFPRVEGFAIKAMLEYTDYDNPSVIIVGKRKPHLPVAGNENRIQRYIDSFESLKRRFKGVPYKDAFPIN